MCTQHSLNAKFNHLSAADLIAILGFLEAGRYEIPDFVPGLKPEIIDEINYRIISLVGGGVIEHPADLPSRFDPCGGCGEKFLTFPTVMTLSGSYCHICVNQGKHMP